MRTKTESIYFHACLADGFKLLIKNTPLVLVLGTVMFGLNYLRNELLEIIVWHTIWVRHGLVLTWDAFAPYNSLPSTASLNTTYHLIEASTFLFVSSVTIIGITLLTAKALQFLKSEDTSLKVTWHMVKSNALKLILLNIVLQILVRIPWNLFDFLAILHFATPFDLSNVLKFFQFVPALTTCSGRAAAQHFDIFIPFLPMGILPWIFALLIAAVGQYFITYIVGGYGSHLVKNSLTIAKRTFPKMAILSLIIEILRFLLTFPNKFIFYQIASYDLWRILKNLELFAMQFLILFAITTFTVLFFHAMKRKLLRENYYKEGASLEMFFN